MTSRSLFIGSLCTALLLAGNAAAQKETYHKGPDPSVLATENVKDLMLLMDTDKNGKITKEEWMKFMEQEFDRLDTDKSGALDPKELQRTRLSVKAVRSSDTGK